MHKTNLALDMKLSLEWLHKVHNERNTKNKPISLSSSDKIKYNFNQNLLDRGYLLLIWWIIKSKLK